VNIACVVATGVNAQGNGEILGAELFTTEDGPAGRRSCSSGGQGPFGRAPVISDAHPGLVDAIASTLPGSGWQRCRTHFMCNLLAGVPRSAGSFVATLVRSIFAQPDAEAAAWAQFHRVVEQLGERFPEAAVMLEAAGPGHLGLHRVPSSPSATDLVQLRRSACAVPGGLTLGPTGFVPLGGTVDHPGSTSRLAVA
jgi:putative transposase